MKELPLSQGKVALVDDEDYERCAQYKWTASFGSRSCKWYAKRRRKKHEPGAGTYVWLHHFILEIASKTLPPGYVVDHVNHDGLDCRKTIDGKVQLEVVTQTENMARSPGWTKNWKNKPGNDDGTPRS